MMPDFQVTPPAFSLFERVRSNYCYEDCQATEDEGVVLGLVYSPLQFIRLHTPGWVYFIYWFHIPSSPHIQPPLIDKAMEEDLVRVEAVQSEPSNQQGGQSNE